MSTTDIGRDGGEPAISSRAAMRCPCCPPAIGPHALGFWRADAMPVLSHVLCRTRDAALAVPRAPIDLALCRGCGLVYNRAFDPRQVRYEADYENALHHSSHFRDYVEALARHLVEARQIRGGRVLEIGCGDGQFLRRLCALGANEGLGFDPAADPARSGDAGDTDGRVRIVPEMFDAGALEAFPADLICARHVLEHLHDPLFLLRALRAAIGEARRPLVYLEVPNFLNTLERMAVWDVIYEHCLHLTPTTLRHLCRLAGFVPLDAGEAYGGQFAWIELVPAPAGDSAALRPGNGPTFLAECEALVTSFEQWCSARMDQMRRQLEQLAGDGRRAVVWGAGSKTVTMLNALGVSERTVAAVVDQNPRKQGGFVVGTGHPIIEPAAVKRYDPGAVVVMNPLYQDEVAAQLDAMDAAAQVVVG